MLEVSDELCTCSPYEEFELIILVYRLDKRDSNWSFRFNWTISNKVIQVLDFGFADEARQ